MKMDEIIVKHYNTVYADNTMSIIEIKSAMKEYAEIYARECLEIASKVNIKDITKIKLPKHK